MCDGPSMASTAAPTHRQGNPGTTALRLVNPQSRFVFNTERGGPVTSTTLAFTHAAVRCKSIFDNAGIAAAVVERRVREWRGARRAKLAEAGARCFFFFGPVAARRRCWRKA